MIAATRNKKAGATIVAGVFLFLAAIGINTIYSIQSLCLETDPPQCFSGYDGLSEVQRTLLSPGMYVIALAIVIVGGILWLRNDLPVETRSV